MNDNDIIFGTLTEKNGLTDIKSIKRSDIARCPMVIFLPSHYRADGSCRCDETTCEYDGCINFKWGGEIYCQVHCDY